MQTSDQIVQDKPERIYIATDINVLATTLFRGRIVGSSEPLCTEAWNGQRLKGTGDAKIHDFCLAGRGDHNVVGLQILVDDAVFMGILQTTCDLQDDS